MIIPRFAVGLESGQERREGISNTKVRVFGTAAAAALA